VSFPEQLIAVQVLNWLYKRNTVHLLINISFNPLNSELNPICHLLALLGAHHILRVSRVRVNAHPKPVKASPHNHTLLSYESYSY
jgi:hypothetical protein